MSDQSKEVSPAQGVDQPLLERAEASRRLTEAEAGSDVQKRRVLFAFDVGGISLSVLATDVRSVEDLKSPCRVPGCPPHVPGVVSHAGRVVPVLDLARFLGLEEVVSNSEDDLGRRMIVMGKGDLEVSVPCDRARGLVDVLETDLSPPNVLQGKVRRFLEGELQRPEGVLGLLDLGSLLDIARVA